MNITLKIQRFNPETDTAPSFREYALTVEPTDRILDALLMVKERFDASLAVRKSCGHGVCGSDAMRINGVERLACKSIIGNIAHEGETLTIEPLRSMKIQRDLMVDQSEFFEKYRSVKPFLNPKQPAPKNEYIQSPVERARIDDPTKCILCSACYSACPVLSGKNPEFVGPAAVIQAARFVFDSRDEGLAPRIGVLDRENGALACENHFDCTKVCPRGIKVTKTINETKRAITSHKGAHH